MAMKLKWAAPSDASTSQIEIYRAESQTGTYSRIDTISATDDKLLKNNTNSWIVEYIDIDGEYNHWYYIKQYSPSAIVTNLSITTSYIATLCKVEDVKQIIDTAGKWSDDEIFDAILTVDDDIYIEMGSPLQVVQTDVGVDNSSNPYRIYYLGEEKIYRIDHVFYGTTTKTELNRVDDYLTNKEVGMIKIMPYTATVNRIGSVATVAAKGVKTLSVDADFEIRFTPNIYNRLSAFRTAKTLIDKIDYVNKSGKPSKDAMVMQKRLDFIENLLSQRNSWGLSSTFSNFDETYGINKKSVSQDFDKNKYIGSTKTSNWE